MVDILALALSHGLLLLAAWRLLSRPELDDEDAPDDRRKRARGALRTMRVKPVSSHNNSIRETDA